MNGVRGGRNPRSLDLKEPGAHSIQPRSSYLWLHNRSPQTIVLEYKNYLFLPIVSVSMECRVAWPGAPGSRFLIQLQSDVTWAAVLDWGWKIGLPGGSNTWLASWCKLLVGSSSPCAPLHRATWVSSSVADGLPRVGDAREQGRSSKACYNPVSEDTRHHLKEVAAPGWEYQEARVMGLSCVLMLLIPSLETRCKNLLWNIFRHIKRIKKWIKCTKKD